MLSFVIAMFSRLQLCSDIFFDIDQSLDCDTTTPNNLWHTCINKSVSANNSCVNFGLLEYPAKFTNREVRLNPVKFWLVFSLSVRDSGNNLIHPFTFILIQKNTIYEGQGLAPIYNPVNWISYFRDNFLYIFIKYGRSRTGKVKLPQNLSTAI